MADVTKTYHRTTYPAISSASNPQRGRTVLISGGSTGIGLAIARAFVEASADGVIFLGRRQSALDCATKQLYSARPSESSTRIQGISCDITKQEDVGRVWKQLNKDGVQVDVLVLCAAAVGISQVNQFSADHTWNFFQVNVLANLHLFQYFLEQGSGTGKVLLSVSSAAVHFANYPNHGEYAASKVALASLLQHYADMISAETVQIISFHPGAVLTEPAASHGYTKDSLPWDEADLPGNFAVWAATNKAAFLHGRYVWANWDVDELKSMQSRLERDVGLLKIGLQGVPTVDAKDTFAKIAAM